MHHLSMANMMMPLPMPRSTHLQLGCQRLKRRVVLGRKKSILVSFALELELIHNVGSAMWVSA